MNIFRTATKVAFLIVSILAIVQFIWWYNKLPEIVPSHFNGQGEPDGDMPKSSYYLFMGSLHAMFMCGFPLLAWSMKKMPTSLINIPNKEYWLAPERKDETLSFSNMVLLQIGLLSMVLMGLLFHLSSQVAIKTRVGIDPEFFWIMGTYLVIVFSMVALMIFKFRLPAEVKERLSRPSPTNER